MDTNTLVLARHGESEWNAQNRFTGRADPALTKIGEQQSWAIGKALRIAGMLPTTVFTSTLLRARISTKFILYGAEIPEQAAYATDALIERDYGELTGMNRDVANKKFGAEQVRIWRRSTTEAPPGGESLTATAERTRPFLENNILPATRYGKVCLVVAHGNTIRSLVMQMLSLHNETMEHYTISALMPIVYTLDKDDRVLETYKLNAYKLIDSMKSGIS